MVDEDTKEEHWRRDLESETARVRIPVQLEKDGGGGSAQNWMEKIKVVSSSLCSTGSDEVVNSYSGAARAWARTRRWHVRLGTIFACS